ncbi:MAG TPA: isoprenoid biosynthesis protein ElbB [Bdellovibrionales bacterium]|nr:MAG: isoprenoid biosynthesis protein ElbB [Bdellovibrionales bacterium GWB1_52_6]OFZ03428.1 MAG: isoprenoid biosynthesis protein ElbB [Bdellovibrionales bacterium GWA1_52_35]HAR43573.1 isoprenoid biosynthesis protein ElbB [Bdellovibrionales bacterium]HCM41009.1 isoprenoid biosynthesis protein ElbB [Bdellovibrionales bacterium]
MKKIAVVLCGSGYRDGSEIRESVAVLWALSQFPVSVQCFAPDGDQVDVVNCMTGQAVTGERRNMLIESSRIARGDVLPLKQLVTDASHYAGIVLPGGYGAAKNLCSFAFQGAQGEVRPDLKAILIDFHKAGKPIGAICIAPAILALAFKCHPLELTLGEQGDASVEIEKLGHEHFVCKADECHYDARNKIASTPAYMCEGAPLFQIFEGIRKVVERVVQ